MIEQYLLDTCVVSEYVRKQPEMKVIQWLDLQLEEDLFISAITIGEIKKGIVTTSAFPCACRRRGVARQNRIVSTKEVSKTQ